MYQLATDRGQRDNTRLFIDTCTSMLPSRENLSLVGSAVRLMRDALNGNDLKPLREFAARAAERCDIDDVFAAAGQAVVDEFGDVPFAKLHDVILKVAQIERDVLSSALISRRDTLRTTYAS